MPVGSTDSQLTKFFNLLVLIINQSIDIVIYIVNMKYILVVGIFEDISEEHLHFNRFSERSKSIVSIGSSFIWIVRDLSSD